MNILAWPGIVMILGLLIYLLAPPPPALQNGSTRWPRVQEVGKLMFFAGLLVMVLRASGRALLDL